MGGGEDKGLLPSTTAAPVLQVVIFVEDSHGAGEIWLHAKEGVAITLQRSDDYGGLEIILDVAGGDAHVFGPKTFAKLSELIVG
jgi:hypothetical protein